MNWKNGVHDPTIIERDSVYYLFSTDTQQPKTAGIPIRTSLDLIHWQFEKQAFPQLPQSAREWSQAEGLWAPEVIEYQGNIECTIPLLHLAVPLHLLVLEQHRILWDLG